jgi:nucleoid-associated protein YgaU
MSARRTGRYLAPLALVAVVVATALVVRAGLKTTHHPPPPTRTTFIEGRRKASTKRFYRIRSGDTLSTISVKTGVPVAQLEALNHSLVSDPNALQTGQTLRLR